MMTTVIITTAVWGCVLAAVGVIGLIATDETELFFGVTVSGCGLAGVAIIMAALEAIAGGA